MASPSSGPAEPAIEFRKGGAKLGPAIESYAATPAAFARTMITTGGTPVVGDPAKIATAIIASADQNPAPKRVFLGSDSFGIISTALAARLANVQSQRNSAGLTDFPANA